MADRYWVGGSGNWNSTTKWSTTSGGASGASVPTAADNAIFDANSGTGVYTVTIQDSQTCADLTLTPVPFDGVTQFSVGANFVVAGTFSTSGTQGNRRFWFRSSVQLLVRDVSIATIGTVADVDFRDIRIVGAGGAISGTRIGDLKGNSGISFTASKTVYRIDVGNWHDNQWALTSGGTPDVNAYPLPQDTAIFDANTLIGTVNINATAPYVGTVDMSSLAGATPVTTSTNVSVYGNWTNHPTYSGNVGTLIFEGRKTQTITFAGKNVTSLNLTSPNGKLLLADNATATTSININAGTFDTVGYAVSCREIRSKTNYERSVFLRSSAVTVTGFTDPVDFTKTGIMNFDAGTSTITLTNGTSNGNYSLRDQTFYNFVFPRTTTSTRTISGNNTFNNLTVSPPGAGTYGNSQIRLSGNNTVLGTLYLGSNEPYRRSGIASPTRGVPVELNCNAIDADYGDFRDITITGNAVGYSPIGANDLGGSTGINFPSRTVYWNLAGTQNWSANGWAATSGGAPDPVYFPTAQDTVVFDDTGAAGTVTVDNAWYVGNFNAVSRTSAMTLAFGSSGSLVVMKDWTFGTGVSCSSNTRTVTFSPRQDVTITSNGVAFGGNVTVDTIYPYEVSLGDAFAYGSGRAFTVAEGVFVANDFNVTGGTFNSSALTYRIVDMGNGTWSLDGTGNVFTFNRRLTVSGITYELSELIGRSSTLHLTSTSATTRSIIGEGGSYGKILIGGPATTSTTRIIPTAAPYILEITSNKTVAHTVDFSTLAYTFGKFNLSGSSGNVVTVLGTSKTHKLVGPSTSGLDYLDLTNIGFQASSYGEIFVGPNSVISYSPVTGPILFTSVTPTTYYWVGGTGVWNATTNWSLTSGGAGGAGIPSSLDDVVMDVNSAVGNYTVTLSGQTRFKGWSITPPSGATVTCNGTADIFAHGSISFPSVGFNRSWTGQTILSGDAPGNTYATGGKAHNRDIIIEGPNTGWTLSDVITVSGNRSIVHVQGSFDTDGYSVTARDYSGASSRDRSLSLGSSVFSVFETNASYPSFTFLNATLQTRDLKNATTRTLTFDAGTSTITFTGSGTCGADFADLPVYNLNYTNANGQPQLRGSLTANNITVTARTTLGTTVLNFYGDQRQFFVQSYYWEIFSNIPKVSYTHTINGTLTIPSSGKACRRFRLLGTSELTSNLPVPISINAVSSLTDVDFENVAISGTAAPLSGTRIGNRGGVTGVTFSSPKTVYWRRTAGGNWADETYATWATTSNGTPNDDNLPLPQDTAVFTDAGVNNGVTISTTGNVGVGTLSMSGLTNDTIILSGNLELWGDWISDPVRTTFTGTPIYTFRGESPQTITSNGATFTGRIAINCPGNTVTLADNLTTNFANAEAVRLIAGTLNLNGKTLQLSGATGGFYTTYTNTRSLDFGTNGLLLIDGSGTSFAMGSATTSGTFSVSGNGIIRMTSASLKTFDGGAFDYAGVVLDQAGAGILRFADNNTFDDITASYTTTGATVLELDNTTQYVRNFTATGTAGNLLQIIGVSASNPGTMVYIGQDRVENVDYLQLSGSIVVSSDKTWYAGTNSVSEGSFGWIFTDAPPVSTATGNFFMLFN